MDMTDFGTPPRHACAQDLSEAPLSVVGMDFGPSLRPHRGGRDLMTLGSRWQDYVALEQLDPHRIRVVTLRMVPERITEGWLLG